MGQNIRQKVLWRITFVIAFIFLLLTNGIISYATPYDNGYEGYGIYHFDYCAVRGSLENKGMSGSNLVIYINEAYTKRLDVDDGSYLEIGLVSTDSGNPHWYPVASHSPSDGFKGTIYSWCVFDSTGNVKSKQSGNLYLSTAMLTSMMNNGDKTFHYYMYTCNRDEGYYVGLNVTSNSVTLTPASYAHTHNKSVCAGNR